MSAIVGYTGYKPATPILLDGLRSVEYRGYDSVGMYISGFGPFKMVGSVEALADKLPDEVLTATTGIAHTRWATHGAPSIQNTHPHTDHAGNLWVVHNGMVENYYELREELEKKGYVFSSDTDTEVLAHLIGIEYELGSKPQDAVSRALTRVIGTYGIACIFADIPNTIIIASMGNHMSIGIKDGEYFVASDTAPMLRHTSNVVKIENGEYAIISPNNYSIYSFANKRLERSPKTIRVSSKAFTKTDEPRHMLKDILDMPLVLENSIRGRILRKEGDAKFGGLADYKEDLKKIEHLAIVGCGTSYFAGLVGKLMFEKISKVHATVEYGSEYVQGPHLEKEVHSTLLALSQSGETPEIIESIRFAKKNGLKTYGLVNVVGSTISKEIDSGIYNHAGPEMGVRATRSFASQIEVLALMAIHLGRVRGTLTQASGAEHVAEILRIPEKVRMILEERELVKRIAEKYLGYDDFLFIGRGYNIATAYEGALKLKKVSYVHAEGYPAGEVQHGPIAMLNEIFPTVAIMPSDTTYARMVDDVKIIKKRGGPILAIATEGNGDIKKMVDDVLYVPDTKACLSPILTHMPLLLFAYYTGALRGFNSEQPPRPSGTIFKL